MIYNPVQRNDKLCNEVLANLEACNAIKNCQTQKKQMTYYDVAEITQGGRYLFCPPHNLFNKT